MIPKPSDVATPKECSDNGDDVHRVPQGALYTAPTHDRLQQPAHRQGATPLIGHVRHTEANHDINCPGVQAPVEHCQRHRLVSRRISKRGHAA